MKEFLLALLQAVIIAAVPVATTYLCTFLKAKKDEVKSNISNKTTQALPDEACSAVENAVKATNQTYVDSLKKNGTFTIENQKEAFQKSYETAINIMTQEAKDFIATAYGSLSAWLTTQIEAQVKNQKEPALLIGEAVAE